MFTFVARASAPALAKPSLVRGNARAVEKRFFKTRKESVIGKLSPKDENPHHLNAQNKKNVFLH